MSSLNNSFETGDTSGWGISDATTGTNSIDTAIAYHGSNSLKIGISNGGDQYQTIGFNHGVDITGRVFTVSAYIKTQSTTTNIRCATYWRNSGGSWIFQNNVWSTQVVTGTNGWTRLTATGTAPAGAFRSVILIAPQTKDGNGSYWIDAVQIEEKPYATPFTSTYRPASQLPSTIQFGANEVHETGTANFEDFSTVGITDGLDLYLYDSTKRDYSGNNLHGTPSNIVDIDNSYLFNGTTSNISVPNGISYTNGFTLSAFINPTSAGGGSFGRIFDKSDGTTNATAGFALYMNNAPQVALRINAGTTITSAANSAPLNTWTHVMVTVASNGATTIFINGISSGTGTAALPSTITTTGLLNIGSRHGSNDRNYNGYISNIKIFNRPLTPEEVAIEYNTMFNNEVQIHESGVLYAKDIIQY